MFEDLINFLTQDTVIIVTTCIASIAILVGAIVTRVRYADYGEGDIHTYDLARFIVSFVELALYGTLLPLIIFQVIPERTGGFITLGLLVVSIITQIVLKEPIFLLLWKIPTFAIFFAVNDWAEDHVTGYSGYVGPGGHVTLTEDKPVFVVLLAFIVAFGLFMVKAIIMIFYCIAALLGNAILCVGPKQILYGIGLYKDNH